MGLLGVETDQVTRRETLAEMGFTEGLRKTSGIFGFTYAIQAGCWKSQLQWRRELSRSGKASNVTD